VPYISVRVGHTGVAARALGTPVDFNDPEQPRLGPPPTPLCCGPGAPLKLKPGLCRTQPYPILSQIPDLFFLDGAWRDTAGHLSPALSPGWAQDLCPGAGSCCSPLGLPMDPQPSACPGLLAKLLGVICSGALAWLPGESIASAAAAPLPTPAPCHFLSGPTFPFSSV